MRKTKINKKGFGMIGVAIVFFSAVLGFIFAYFVITKKAIPVNLHFISTILTKNKSQQESRKDVGFENWQKYQNNKFGFQISYPPNAELTEPYLKIGNPHPLVSLKWKSEDSEVQPVAAELPAFFETKTVNINVYDNSDFFERTDEEVEKFYEVHVKDGFKRDDVKVENIQTVRLERVRNSDGLKYKRVIFIMKDLKLNLTAEAIYSDDDQQPVILMEEILQTFRPSS